MSNIQSSNIIPGPKPTVEIRPNRKQYEVIQSKAPIKVLQWSRRVGKNFQAGLETGLYAIPNLPRGNFSFINQDIVQLKNQSVPAMTAVWNKLGYKEVNQKNPYGHYIKWQKPPVYFKESWQEPNDYTNVISFINGVRIQLLGLNRKNAARGGTDDYMFIDEAAFLNYEILMNSVKPRLSGPIERYPNNPYHKNLLLISSAPDTAGGFYIYDYERLMKAEPHKYFFSQANIWDNARVLGYESVKDLEQTTRRDIWEREYLNIVDARPTASYYPKFNDKTHLYDLNSRLEDPHYNPNDPMQFSVDFNHNFECCILGQNKSWGKTHQKEFYDPDLDDLCELVCDYYEDHYNKTIYIKGDVTGNHGRSGNKEVLYQIIKKNFESRGWTVIIVTKSKKQPFHEPRYKLIDLLLSEKMPDTPKIRISRMGCPCLIKAMKMTAAKGNYEKDKSCEKGKENRQYHTHLPDAWDYDVWWDYKEYIEDRYSNYDCAIITT